MVQDTDNVAPHLIQNFDPVFGVAVPQFLQVCMKGFRLSSLFIPGRGEVGLRVLESALFEGDFNGVALQFSWWRSIRSGANVRPQILQGNKPVLLSTNEEGDGKDFFPCNGV